ncbi:DoxX family protein [uncultured Aquimarina sp.]|uniref:DoxX family protein n=1 Tax=uncultured Aquimarina sp. TaxID=575652 RepID=UPI0026186D3E|nr:DoxX family protein [uncultured Aquimarina sp.]
MTHIEKRHWSTSSRIFLRFIFLYLLLYIYPYGFEYIRELDTSDISFWKEITIWFGEVFLGWEFDKRNLLNGFDSKYDYSRFLLIIVLSLIGTTIWMIIDSKFRFNYNSKLKRLTRTILRYHIGLTLIIYGLSKVFMLQFGEMDLDRLENTIGNHNGMSYLWTFMSYSKFYTMSTGWVEVIGGVLLLFRRSTFIGSFILFIAMLNVVIIDIGYDVRVKMFAIHLLLMTLLLISNDLRRMMNFFVLNKPTKSIIEQPLFSGQKSKKVGYILKSSILLYFTISCFINFSERIHSQTTNRYPSLTGFHEVETQIVNGDTIPKSITIRWKNISINGSSYRPESIKITHMDKQEHYYSFKADTIKKIIDFHSLNDLENGSENDLYKFTYDKLEDNVYIFQGTYKEDTFWIKTKVKTPKDYRLTKSGMRWITDLK